LEYRDFGFLTRASLEFALLAVGIEPNESITGPLLDKYLNLDPHPEAKEALGGLKKCLPSSRTAVPPCCPRW
jgi:hypothetical protein